MAKRGVMAQAVALTDEICGLVREYILDKRARRKFWQKDFCDEVGVSQNLYGNLKGCKRGCINLNTACILLDAIGYEMKIVKKEDNGIVKLMKEKNKMKKAKYYVRKHGSRFAICDGETCERVAGEPLLNTYKKAKWRVNELNGTENEGFEPLE